MIARIRRFLTGPVFEDEDKAHTARLLNVIVLALLAALLIYGLASLAFQTESTALPLVGLSIVLCLSVLFLMWRGNVQGASLVLVSAIWLLLTLVTVFISGVDQPTTVFGYLVVVVMAGLLLGNRVSFAFVGLSIAAVAGAAWADQLGILPAPSTPGTRASTLMSLSLYLVMTAVCLGIANRSLNDALTSARRSNRELRAIRASLEQRVDERTAELSLASENLHRRVNQLEASSEVSRAATTLTDPEQLIPRVVESIQRGFDFYYVGLFLVDIDKRYAVLQYGVGTSSAREAGRVMKESGYRLDVGGQSMVGWACANKQARIARDVGQDAIRFANPLLPETHSEMALPLRVGERVIGALDVQSTQVAAFDESDIAALQGIADQVAVALENARLFRQTQAALQELEATTRRHIVESWQDYLVQSQAARSAEFASTGDQSVEGKATPSVLRVPLELRGQAIGTLVMERNEDDQHWSDEEADTIRAIVQQATLSLENARLFEETQRRAARERLINEITARIRSSATMDGILNVAVREIGQVTGASFAEIDLELPEVS